MLIRIHMFILNVNTDVSTLWIHVFSMKRRLSLFSSRNLPLSMITILLGEVRTMCIAATPVCPMTCQVPSLLLPNIWPFGINGFVGGGFVGGGGGGGGAPVAHTLLNEYAESHPVLQCPSVEPHLLLESKRHDREFINRWSIILLIFGSWLNRVNLLWWFPKLTNHTSSSKVHQNYMFHSPSHNSVRWHYWVRRKRGGLMTITW
jgi:hypothetical protein